MKTIVAIAIALSVCALNPVGAKENYKESAFNADTKEKFDGVAANVRKELADGGRYEYVKPDERTQIDQKLAEISKLFDENASVQAMKEDTKIKLFNDQEVINSILAKRDRDRVICKKEAPIGSHIPITSCHTYAQEVEAHQGSRDQMAKWQQPPCIGVPTKTNPIPPACYMRSHP